MGANLKDNPPTFWDIRLVRARLHKAKAHPYTIAFIPEQDCDTGEEYNRIEIRLKEVKPWQVVRMWKSYKAIKEIRKQVAPKDLILYFLNEEHMNLNATKRENVN